MARRSVVVIVVVVVVEVGTLVLIVFLQAQGTAFQIIAATLDAANHQGRKARGFAVALGVGSDIARGGACVSQRLALQLIAKDELECLRHE